MAQAKTNDLVGRVLGAGLALSAAFAPSSGSAEDTRIAAIPDNRETVETILCETDREFYAEDGWTSITADLDCAADDARDYAENNPGVGVLIHVGADIPNAHFTTPDEFGQAVVNAFRQNFNTDAQYFLSQSTSRATGITFHLQDHIHGSDNGTVHKNVQEALDAMPEVASELRIMWEDQLAALRTSASGPVLEN